VSASISAATIPGPEPGVRDLLEALAEPALVLDTTTLVHMANGAAAAQLGKGLAGTPLSARMVASAVPDFREFLARCSGSRAPLPGTILLAGGKERLRCRGSLLVPARNGVRALLFLRCSDAVAEQFTRLGRSLRALDAELRERRRTQAVLEEALRDRDTMLRELHHRVKNSIQTVTSMLGTVRREAASPETRAVLDEAARRLAAMAAVHQLLYRSENIGGLQADRFMADLAPGMVRPLGADRRVQAQGSSGLVIANDFAVPLALILHELLANAVTHGPPERPIRAELSETATGFVLLVEDEGPGFVLPPISRRSSGLGLVRGLAGQLGGRFSVERGERGGARCVLRVEPRQPFAEGAAAA
jgi:two-component sensor histidine kinase